MRRYTGLLYGVLKRRICYNSEFILSTLHSHADSYSRDHYPQAGLPSIIGHFPCLFSLPLCNLLFHHFSTPLTPLINPLQSSLSAHNFTILLRKIEANRKKSLLVLPFDRLPYLHLQPCTLYLLSFPCECKCIVHASNDNQLLCCTLDAIPF